MGGLIFSQTGLLLIVAGIIIFLIGRFIFSGTLKLILIGFVFLFGLIFYELYIRIKPEYVYKETIIYDLEKQPADTLYMKIRVN